jgi:hypothetical protein
VGSFLEAGMCRWAAANDVRSWPRCWCLQSLLMVGLLGFAELYTLSVTFWRLTCTKSVDCSFPDTHGMGIPPGDCVLSDSPRISHQPGSPAWLTLCK